MSLINPHWLTVRPGSNFVLGELISQGQIIASLQIIEGIATVLLSTPDNFTRQCQ